MYNFKGPSLLQTNTRVSRTLHPRQGIKLKLCIVLVGMCIGFACSYFFMGFSHMVIEIGSQSDVVSNRDVALKLRDKGITWIANHRPNITSLHHVLPLLRAPNPTQDQINQEKISRGTEQVHEQAAVEAQSDVMKEQLDQQETKDEQTGKSATQKGKGQHENSNDQTIQQNQESKQNQNEKQSSSDEKSNEDDANAQKQSEKLVQTSLSDKNIDSESAETSKQTESNNKELSIHTIMTSNGSPYQNFQTKIAYGTYLLTKKMEGGRQLTGFTRVLHRQSDDALSAIIPTFRVDPRNPECDVWCSFPVADRPNAIRQWLDAAKNQKSMIKGNWILLIESDYVFMKPPQAPGPSQSTSKSIGFPFGYITPSHPAIEEVMERLIPEDSGISPKDIPGTGPAPVLLRFDELANIAPQWESIADKIEDDKEAIEKIGWVREMYAFSIATVAASVSMEFPPPPQSTLIVQPPADHNLGEAAMVHYTWATIIHNATKQEVWRFEKRDFMSEEVVEQMPEFNSLPPYESEFHQIEGPPITEDLYNLLNSTIDRVNEGIREIKMVQN